MNGKEKLEALRAQMDAESIDGYLVPRTDEYQGEYVPAYAERLKWLTGFTGSAGIAIILKDKAVVMSDGRYTIQLQQQVDSTLYITDDNTKTPVQDWLKAHAREESVIGFDPKLFTPSQIEKIQSELKDSAITLRSVSNNLIDEIWSDQPKPPMGKVELFPDEIAGIRRGQKVMHLSDDLKEKKADALILTLSDSIAWLLNIRGADVPHIPVALSYLILEADGKALLFIEAEKVAGLDLGNTVEIRDPATLESAFKDLAEKTVWLDRKRSPLWFEDQLKEAGADILDAQDPCLDIRAQKTQNEQEAMKQAHIRDGVAVTRFLHWLSENWDGQDELSVEAKLQAFREETGEFREPSFDTIAGFGANGAIVHYRATDKTCKKLEAGSLLLVDSGGQYLDGTTDITRTIAIGEPAKEMKERNTLVLKGHIAVALAHFKEGTLGREIDSLAREPLKAKGLNYAHGTGHGVGCYLSVHEYAAHLSPRGEEPPKAGMVLSNEPGYYKEGEYGIRIENLVLVQEAGSGMLSFETITLAPLDKSLIVKEMLSDNEIKWVNSYHARVHETLSPLLGDDVQEWFREACAEI